MFGIRFGWIVLGAVLVTACGGAVADEGDGQDPVASQSTAAARRYHYLPAVEGVRWEGGCGIYKPGQTCDFGFVLTDTKSYADLKTTLHRSINQRTKTVTITVDTWSTSQIHSMIAVRPQDLVVGPLGARAGTTYTVKVKDYRHRLLWSGRVTPTYHL